MQTDIIRMAREECPYTSDEMRGAFYEGFIKGSAAEREACAQIAFDADHMGSVNLKLMKNRIGNAIRARKDKQ